MAEERRARVTFFIPAGTTNEKAAVLAIQRYLQRQRQNKNLAVTGYTRSRIKKPAFRGAWWFRFRWLREPVVLFLIDYNCRVDDHRLERELFRLNRAIRFFYYHAGSRQEAVWIVKEDVVRHVNG